MITARKFRTKYGYCHILPDRIVFTHRNLLGTLGDMAIEGKMSRVLVTYSFLALFTLYFSWVQVERSNEIWAVIFAIIGGYLAYAVIQGLNLSAHPIIRRSGIEQVQYSKPIEGLNPPTVEIRFKDHKGRTRRRLIALKFGEEQQALVALKAEGLMD